MAINGDIDPDIHNSSLTPRPDFYRWCWCGTWYGTTLECAQSGDEAMNLGFGTVQVSDRLTRS